MRPGNILTGLSIRRYESFRQCPSWNAVKAREPRESLEKQWGVHILFKQEADGGIIVGDSHEYASVAEYDRLGFDLSTDINTFMIDEAAKIMNLHSWDVETSTCKDDDDFKDDESSCHRGPGASPPLSAATPPWEPVPSAPLVQATLRYAEVDASELLHGPEAAAQARSSPLRSPSASHTRLCHPPTDPPCLPPFFSLPPSRLAPSVRFSPRAGS